VCVNQTLVLIETQIEYPLATFAKAAACHDLCSVGTSCLLKSALRNATKFPTNSRLSNCPRAKSVNLRKQSHLGLNAINLLRFAFHLCFQLLSPPPLLNLCASVEWLNEVLKRSREANVKLITEIHKGTLGTLFLQIRMIKIKKLLIHINY